MTQLWGYPIVNLRTELETLIDIAAENARDLHEHFHNYERWLGKLAVPAGGKVTNEATLTPFQAVSGNNTWGTAIQIIDANDTPVSAGSNRFDFHRIIIIDTSVTSVYRMRLSIGDTYAAGISAGTYTGIIFRVAAATRQTPIDIRLPNLVVGTRVWAAIWNLTNGATADFFIGLHEYAE